MQKRINIRLAALLLVLAAAATWCGLIDREPVYQGKGLSVWLEDPRPDWVRPTTGRAIRAMGTDALPTLLKMVQIRDSTVRRAFRELCNRQALLRLHIRPVEDIQREAVRGFMALGPIAKPAVPKLARLLEDDDPQVRYYAALCLGSLGPTSHDAVPALSSYLTRLLKTRTGSQWNVKEEYGAAYALCEIGPAAQSAIAQLTALSTLTNSVDWGTRAFAQAALLKIRGDSLLPLAEALKDTSDETRWFNEKGGNIIFDLGTNAEPVIPVLLGVLQQTNTSIRIQRGAIQVLALVHARPESCIPAITPFLLSTNSVLRHDSLRALSAFGSAARKQGSVSEIVRCLNDPDAFVRTLATNALLRIDPEAAAKAGVK